MKFKLLIILGVFLVSFAGIFVKMIDIEPSVVAMYRLGFGGLLLLPFALKSKDIKKLKVHDLRIVVLAGLLIALHYLIWFTSLQFTSVTSSTLIICLEPLITLAFAFILYKEKIAFNQFVVLIIALVGVTVVAWGDIYLSQEAILGDILTFISVIFFVIYLFICQNVVKKYSFIIFTSILFISAGILLFIYNLMMGFSMFDLNGKEWGVILLMATIPNAGQVIFNYTLRYVKSSLVATSILLEPIFATILAIIILKDQVFMNQIIGGVVIITCVYIYIKLEIPNQKQEPITKPIEVFN